MTYLKSLHPNQPYINGQVPLPLRHPSIYFSGERKAFGNIYTQIIDVISTSGTRAGL